MQSDPLLKVKRNAEAWGSGVRRGSALRALFLLAVLAIVTLTAACGDSTNSEEVERLRAEVTALKTLLEESRGAVTTPTSTPTPTVSVVVN